MTQKSKTEITHQQLVQRMVALLEATNSSYIEMSTGDGHSVGDKIRVQREEVSRVYGKKRTKVTYRYKVISDSYGETMVEPHQEYFTF